MSRQWYSESRQAIKAIYGGNWPLMAGFLAATSPNCSLKANITLAQKAFNEFTEFGQINPAHFMRTHAAGLNAIWQGGVPNGRKVRSFMLNLLGHEDCVTVDVWVTRWARRNPELLTVQSSKQPGIHYDAIEHHIQWLARLDGISPAQKQAEIWCKIRGDSHSYADYLKQYRMI